MVDAVPEQELRKASNGLEPLLTLLTLNPIGAQIALLAVVIILMLGGAATLVGEWIAAGIAIPSIATGIALVVIARSDAHHQHVKRVPVP